MSRITLDAAAVAKLKESLARVEICDESGVVIGQFTPMPPPELMRPQISDEEIERRKSDPGQTYTTEEVIDYLKKL